MSAILLANWGKESEPSLTYDDLFKILAKVGTVAYRLELPEQLSRVHSTVFTRLELESKSRRSWTARSTKQPEDIAVFRIDKVPYGTLGSEVLSLRGAG
ncbi:hypothetical protein Tco_0337476 [Tanacetum coccineum]